MMGRAITEEMYRRINPHKALPAGGKSCFPNEGRREKREKVEKERAGLSQPVISTTRDPPDMVGLTEEVSP